MNYGLEVVASLVAAIAAGLVVRPLIWRKGPKR